MNIPEGYMKDAQGRLVPLALIKEVDQVRDRLVRDLVAGGKEMARMLAEYRKRSLAEVRAFQELSAEKYGVALRENAGGSVTLNSYDGDLRVVVDRDDRVTFNEQLAFARQLIFGCIERWTEKAGPQLRALVEKAFRVNRKGTLSVTKILELRQVEIQDADWQQAMRALTDALQVVGSAIYLRIYQRGPDGKYGQIPLDVFPPEEGAPMACAKAHACATHQYCGDTPCPQCARTLPLPLGEAGKTEGGAQ